MTPINPETVTRLFLEMDQAIGKLRESSRLSQETFLEMPALFNAQRRKKGYGES